MINHIWSVLCESSIVDQDSKLISLINVLEEITVPDEPAPNKVLQVIVSLATLWARSDLNTPEKGFARINFTSPAGEVLQSLDQIIDLTKYERLRSRGQFVGLKLPDPGMYFFYVEFRANERSKWNKVAKIPFKVVFKKP
jgi:hypothetical protein